MAWVGLLLGAAQTGIGIAEKAKAKKDAAKALGQRRSYQTPEELYKILSATQNNAQTGFDSATMQYATNETDRAFDASLSTNQLLGGDPNSQSAIFGEKLNAIMGIANQSHAVKMQNFNQFLGALSSVGQSKDAEFFSQQNLVKDKQQQAGVDLANSSQQISAGLNTGLASLAAITESNLYDNPKISTKAKFKDEYRSQGKGAYNYAKKNGLTYEEYKAKAANLPNFNF